MNLKLIYRFFPAALLLGALGAHADSVVTTRPTGTDSVTWSQLGSRFGVPFSFLTANGVTGVGSYAGSVSAQGYQDQQAPVGLWSGNFAPGDFVMYDDDYGPLTLSFAQGYTQIGAQIQDAYYGDFTAQICDANGCFSENGASNGLDDNSAIYIGISSSSPISWVTLSVTATLARKAQHPEEEKYFARNDFGAILGCCHPQTPCARNERNRFLPPLIR